MRPIALLLAAALIAACGSDGEDSGLREYRDRVERLCREGEREAERLADRFGGEVEDALPFFRETLERAREDQERIERLDPPDALADEHERSIDLGRRAIEGLEKMVDGLEEATDPAAVLRREFPPLLRLVDKSNELAREMKLDDCVVEPVPPEARQPAPS